MDNAERDQEIALKYSKGRPATKLAQEYGLSVPQIRRITKAADVVAGPKEKLMEEDKVLDPTHLKLGNRLYAYRFSKMNDVHIACDFLGWSVKKLRGIEKGQSSLTLFDLKSVAKYMQITLGELMKNME